MVIQELFQDEIKVPSLPEVFYQFKQAVDDPESSFEEIGEIIGHDPGLTVRLLKIVNSAFYGFPQQVETISHAIGIIGRQQLNDLVISTVVMDQFQNVPQSSFNLNSFWKHSIACGLSAQYLALVKGEALPERFFVAGLLHDIGRLVIFLNLPFKALEVSLRSKSNCETLHIAEFEAMGFNHADVGGFLMQTWKLPKCLVEAVGFHHNPGEATEFSFEASMIHVADIIANTLDLEFQSEEKIIIPTMDEYASERIQVPKDSLFSNIKKQVEKEFEQTVQIFLQT